MNQKDRGSVARDQLNRARKSDKQADRQERRIKEGYPSPYPPPYDGTVFGRHRKRSDKKY